MYDQNYSDSQQGLKSKNKKFNDHPMILDQKLPWGTPPVNTNRATKGNTDTKTPTVSHNIFYDTNMQDCPNILDEK